MATDVIKVYTPIKRVPIVVGKAQNGQKLPFGPYTLPQIIGGVTVIVIASLLAMALPVNPAVTFIAGLIVTVIVVFGIGLIPYTGVRLTSRIMWVGRLVLIRKPVSASGIPVSEDSARHTMFVEESVVVILPDRVVESLDNRPVHTSLPPENVLDRWSKTLTKANEGDGVRSGERS
ncbi:hypothetical protein AB0L57_30150 [Nocardia sp. NPDC052254]|uniref:hypothetical protein n=1 Tax=Nocardia sp. NPDC052254 TaxID=3155681 RepID=UPI0034249BCC